MRLTVSGAIGNARAVGQARLFPREGDPRLREGAVFSEIFPRFALTRGTMIFTLGSCFSRSVEGKLEGFSLPASRVAAPRSERLGRPNGILNEYNPGTMCQRIEYAVRRANFGELCIAPEGDGHIDLLLADYVKPATKTRLMARRAEVDGVYAALFECEAIVVTLDLVEAWFDKETGLYVNRIPPTAFLLAARDRFEMHIMDARETYLLLERIARALIDVGVKKILMMVSPVPLDLTYSGRDCAAANIYSKSVLVASATELSIAYAEVDYFPAYEIVTSAGLQTYQSGARAPNAHDGVVEQVTALLIERYVS